MKDIFDKFNHEGTYDSYEPYGHGHINQTYLVRCKNPDKHYILQWINPTVFKDIPKLMRNIERVTNHLKKQIKQDEIVLTCIKTHKGSSYVYHKGNYYRLYPFIEHSISYEQAPDQRYLERAGQAFGEFQNNLSSFNPNQLYETIKDFHHTKNRYKAFVSSLKKAIPERLFEAKAWIHLIHERKHLMSLVDEGICRKLIPLRVTHNDTKINNILFDRDAPKVLCIVDLDTVMPGSLLYDFGDAIRSGCSTTQEDETNLDLVDINLEYFEAFTKGFIKPLRTMMTYTEFQYLALSSVIITLELGMRFLMDYLLGDHYFKIEHEKHNFERAKNQLTLVKKLEDRLDDMNEIIKKYK